jgi:hypothetical protein
MSVLLNPAVNPGTQIQTCPFVLPAPHALTMVSTHLKSRQTGANTIPWRTWSKVENIAKQSGKEKRQCNAKRGRSVRKREARKCKYN